MAKRSSVLFSESVAIVLSILPLITIQQLPDPIVQPKIYAIFFCVTASIIIFSPGIITFFERKPQAPVPVKWALLYLLLITLTLQFSQNIYRSLYGVTTRMEGYLVLVFYILMFLLAAFFYRPRPWHLKLYLCGAVVMALHALLIRYETLLFGIDPRATDLLVLQFTGCGNQNFLGSYMALALPVALWAAFRSGGLAYPAAGMIYFGLLSSNTRGSWIGACVVFGMMVLCYWRQPGCRRRILIICGIFVAITLVYFTTSTGATDRFKSFGSVNSRGFIYWVTAQLIFMRPGTGWGIETLDFAIFDHFQQQVIDYFGYYAIIDKAHCEILQVAFCSGIPAAVAFVGTQLSTVIRGIRRFALWGPQAPLLFGIGAYMIAALWNISVVNVAPILWTFCGMLVSVTRTVEEDPDPEAFLMTLR
ncbi:O-antigen ligase family protein [Eubacterium barkeri]|uniref:O-antigen ligase n=1 Tax=Eubacterium barkeri TaxID=1528 RepID=A0A1H3AV51_EUBBA|nr:O-antigen ligase family protein [Eubacterium barkeri]SDX33586.1 O-antigen ligase [Eubacterium barkeri]